MIEKNTEKIIEFRLYYVIISLHSYDYTKWSICLREIFQYVTISLIKYIRISGGYCNVRQD